MEPNILIVMVDQFNGTLLPDGPGRLAARAQSQALAERSVRFANAYAAAAMCAGAGRRS